MQTTTSATTIRVIGGEGSKCVTGPRVAFSNADRTLVTVTTMQEIANNGIPMHPLDGDELVYVGVTSDAIEVGTYEAGSFELQEVTNTHGLAKYGIDPPNRGVYVHTNVHDTSGVISAKARIEPEYPGIDVEVDGVLVAVTEYVQHTGEHHVRVYPQDSEYPISVNIGSGIVELSSEYGGGVFERTV